ncbi:MAG: ribonuclease PH [Actinobacteria bacterium]|nr:ribonuclease PH [Actinomycetota bacterium]
MARADGRRNDEIRPLEFLRGYIPHAEGSCFVKMGNTWVICTATVEEKVPGWLKGCGRGWITAEYSMLPRATGTRTLREASMGRVGGRTHEIQRIIGRSLRSVINMSLLPEITIRLDCDVIRADGSTRVAAVNGAFIALYEALAGLRDERKISEMPLDAFVAGISVGIVEGKLLTDLTYDEDSRAQVDLNLVMTDSGNIVEVQGTAEQKPFTRSELDSMLSAAEAGIARIISAQRASLFEGLASQSSARRSKTGHLCHW